MSKKKKLNKSIEPQADYVCLNPRCMKGFRASARQTHASYCSNACKQKMYRSRKKISDMDNAHGMGK